VSSYLHCSQSGLPQGRAIFSSILVYASRQHIRSLGRGSLSACLCQVAIADTRTAASVLNDTYDGVRYTANFSHRPRKPPSTNIVCPLTYAAASLARKTVGPLKSSGLPHRPCGIRSSICLCRVSSFIKASFMSVSM
jgi:hypothetical protein